MMPVDNIYRFLHSAVQHGISINDEGCLTPRGEPDKKAIKIFASFLQENRHLLGERELNLVDIIIEHLKQQNSATLTSRVHKLCSFARSLRYCKEFNEYVPKRPECHAEITEEAKQEFLSYLDSGTRVKAEAALRTIKYVTFEEFLRGLESATIHLCQNIDPNEKFVVLYDSAKGKSGLWTTKLAYEFIEKSDRKPLLIQEWSFFDNPQLKVNEEYSNVKRIVIFDDACYSGTQMRRALEQLEKRGSLHRHFPQAKISVVVPYITDVALEHLKPTRAEFFFYEKMEPFPSNDLKFRCNHPNFKGEFDGITATYMQHKVAAAGHSTVPLIETGLIKEFQPPYR